MMVSDYVCHVVRRGVGGEAGTEDGGGGNGKEDKD